MDIFISPRGTGACPFCRKFVNCHIVQAVRDTLTNEVKPIYDERVLVEMVIYACPEFEEKT